jgi:hypothetical protein
LKVTFGPEVTDRQPEDGQPVELGQDVLFEWQQAGQCVQFSVQPLPMPLTGVALRDAVLRGRLQAATGPQQLSP